MIKDLRLFILALILTILIEVGVARLFGLKEKKELLTVVLVNVITNPLLNYLILVNAYFHLIGQSQILILIIEALVVLVEWRILVWALSQRAKKMFLLSLVMNACSFLVGLFLANILRPISL
jgi:hypothetical protein